MSEYGTEYGASDAALEMQRATWAEFALSKYPSAMPFAADLMELDSLEGMVSTAAHIARRLTPAADDDEETTMPATTGPTSTASQQRVYDDAFGGEGGSAADAGDDIGTVEQERQRLKDNPGADWDRLLIAKRRAAGAA